MWRKSHSLLSLLCGFQGRKSLRTQAFWFSCLSWHGRLYIWSYICTIHSVCIRNRERERVCKAMHTLTLYTCIHACYHLESYLDLRTAPEHRSLYQSFPEMETIKQFEATNSAKHLHGLIASEHQKIKSTYILVTPLGNWEPPSLLPACPLCKEPLQHSCCCVYTL